MLEKDLEGLGLSKNEAVTYLALQEMGKTRAGELIKETGLHRHLVYQALGALAEKHLLTKSSAGSVALFQATDPLHLLDGIREQELTAERVIETLKEKKKIIDQEITIYEGAEGMRAFSLKNAASLQVGEKIYVLGSGGNRFEKAMGPQALKKYFKLIDERGGAKVLMYQPQQYTDGLSRVLDGKENFEVRVLPFNMTPSAGVVFTNTSVAFHIYEDPIAVIEIKNPHLVAAYRNYFEVLWNQQVRIETGVDAIERAFTDILKELKPGDEYYSIGTHRGTTPELEKFFDEYHTARVQRGVACNLLSYKQDTSRIRERFSRAGDPEGKISRIRPMSQAASGPIQILLYGGKVLIPIYDEQPMAILLENAQLYTGLKQYFDELWNRRMQTLEGYDGIVELCELILQERENLYLIGATGSILTTHPEYYPEFTKRRVEAGIRLEMLANASIRGNAFTKISGASVAYLPPEFESPMVVWVFGDYVANVLWQEPQKIFLTRDRATADMYRRHYSALKKIAVD